MPMVRIFTFSGCSITMSDKHSIYYYDDGDIFLQAENTTFLVHKSILSLSSEFFNDMFELSKPTNIEHQDHQSSLENKSLPIIELSGETIESTEKLLSLIYSKSDNYQINWDNIEDFLRISDKFMIDKVMKYCCDFLSENFKENILFTFRMAERYFLAEIFKESSKLVLDDLEKYRLYTEFNLLHEETKLKLTDTWYKYAVLLNKHLYTKKTKNEKAIINSYLDDKTATILKPSTLKHQFIDLPNLIEDFEKLIENYEPLKSQPINENVRYIFIELY